MPTIEISEQTFKRLQNRARPIIDSTDDVINNILDELEYQPDETRNLDLSIDQELGELKC